MSKIMLVAAIICGLAATSACGHSAHPGTESADGPVVGVTTYHPDKCYNGYTLYQGRHSTNLIDMNGRIVHTWPWAEVIQPPLKNGWFATYLWHGVDEPHDETLRTEFVTYDWDGDVVWSHKADQLLHHDYYWTAGGNVLMLYNYLLAEEHRAKISDEKRRNEPIRCDGIIKVTPHGNVVWEWHAHEHLDVNHYCPICGARDWLHVNTVQELPETALGERDPRFEAGNILINPRNLNTIFIIDRGSGDVVWSWGTDVLRHAHHATMLESGNIILFDNGIHRPPWGLSRVLEVDPSTGEIVWEYSEGTSFFSGIASGVQRLPNGNTLICSRNQGRLFEVTPEKEIVWEFTHEGKSYRAFRIPYDHCPQSAALPRPK